MRARVCVVNLGCKVNRVESDWMESAFSEAGCILVPEDQADLIAVNTCAVTGEAQAKTRKAIRHAAALPQHPLVTVTGCVANLFPKELESLSPRVHVLPNKQTLATESLNLLEQSRKESFPSPATFIRSGNIEHSQQDLYSGAESACEGDGPHPPSRVPQPLRGEDCLSRGGCGPSPQGARVFRSRRGVKVQDGCDNRCTYCIVWRARGASRSMPLPSIEAQVRQVLAERADEVVLSGINLGHFRATDETGREIDLGDLIDRVCRLGARMVRLSSIEPPDLTDSVITALARHPEAVCAHLHLPLQAGSDSVLARMGRHYTTAQFATVVERVRAAVPHVSLSTDVIVGFPGETEAEFEETLAFCERMAFSKMHVFRYSARPETEAAAMPCQIDPRTAQKRSERLRALASDLRKHDALSRIGTVERVLVERIDAHGAAHGSTASYHDVVLPAGNHGLTAPGLATVELQAVAPGTEALLVGQAR